MSKNTSNMFFETCWTLCKKPHFSTWSRSRYTFFWMTRYLSQDRFRPSVRLYIRRSVCRSVRLKVRRSVSWSVRQDRLERWETSISPCLHFFFFLSLSLSPKAKPLSFFFLSFFFLSVFFIFFFHFFCPFLTLHCYCLCLHLCLSLILFSA